MSLYVVLAGCLVLAVVTAVLATWGFIADSRTEHERRINELNAIDEPMRRRR